jgi:hypothetical protein
MKKTIIVLTCLLLALLVFAQPNPTNKTQATAEPITVTGTVIKMTTEEGAAANYQPFKLSLCARTVRIPRAVMFPRAWSRCEQERRSDPNRDQTRHSRACLLRKRGRFACG